MRWGLVGYALCLALTALLCSPFLPDLVNALLLPRSQWVPSASVRTVPMNAVALLAFASLCACLVRVLRTARGRRLRANAPWLLARIAAVALIALLTLGTTAANLAGRRVIDERWAQAVAELRPGMAPARVEARLAASHALFEAPAIEHAYNRGFGSEREVEFRLEIDYGGDSRLARARYVRREHDWDLERHDCSVLREIPAAAGAPPPYACPE